MSWNMQAPPVAVFSSEANLTGTGLTCETEGRRSYSLIMGEVGNTLVSFLPTASLDAIRIK